MPFEYIVPGVGRRQNHETFFIRRFDLARSIPYSTYSRVRRGRLSKDLPYPTLHNFRRSGTKKNGKSTKKKTSRQKKRQVGKNIQIPLTIFFSRRVKYKTY